MIEYKSEKNMGYEKMDTQEIVCAESAETNMEQCHQYKQDTDNIVIVRSVYKNDNE